MNEPRAFKVLSDETRRRILNLLLEEECCVCQVMQVLEILQYKGSRGLISLHGAGFLKMRRDGLWSFYSLANKGTNGYRAQLVEAVGEALKNNKLAALDKQRLKTAERVETKCVRSERGVSYKAASL